MTSTMGDDVKALQRLREIEGKMSHDPYNNNPLSFITTSPSLSSGRCVWVPGPIIIGGGPSGLAVSACLKCKGIPSLIIERSNCIASLWQQKTYDRLKLHLPKQFCELPFMPFPRDFPTYPTKQQFIRYLIDYAKRFDINPVFNQRVVSAEFDHGLGLWRVRVTDDDSGSSSSSCDEVEYLSRWIVAATGENAEAVLPEIEGLCGFEGEVMHTCRYKSGSAYKGKRVLVVGSGNSGMEVSLDLCNHQANPFLVVKDAVHLLPRDMLGTSTFGLSMWLLKWFPIRTVDWFLLAVARVMLGDTSRLGLKRPKVGPLELKTIAGKTPVLDIGTLDKIKSGDIQVFPGIRRVKHRSSLVEFVDGRTETFDAIILATGYKSNVPCWLKENEMFSNKNGLPKQPFPNGWKGQKGLYAVGFTKRGLLGSSMDARNIAQDIERCWNTQARHHMIQCKALY